VLALATPSWTDNQAALVLTPITAAPVTGALGPLMTWDVAAGGTALAVRPTLSSELNLNVAGTGPYAPGNPVIAYAGWGGGQPNEIWTFQDDGTGGGGYPWYFTFAPECAGSMLLSAAAEDANGPLTLQTPVGGLASPLQIFSANYYVNGTDPLGVVFVNQELGMQLSTTPGGGALFCVDSAAPTAYCAWLTGPGPDANSTCIRSSPEPGLYWNASGNGPYDDGNPVISYPWQGGAQNEQWVMTFMGQQMS